MKRRFFRILAGFSLLLCVALAVLWVRSVGHLAYRYWIRPELSIHFLERDGVMGFIVARDSGLRSPVSGTNQLYGWFSERHAILPNLDRASGIDPSFNRWGFGFHLLRTVGHPPAGLWRFGGRRVWIIFSPYWLPVLLSAILPCVVFVQMLRQRRRKRTGLCPCCGYDLRASPGRCPECGNTKTLVNNGVRLKRTYEQ